MELMTPLIILAGLIAMGLWADSIGHENGIKEVQQEAIDKGFAHYDAKTGEFTWNEK